jgi:hypothetical protein
MRQCAYQHGLLRSKPEPGTIVLATWVTTIIVYTLHTWAHADLPSEVAASLTGLIGFAAGWLAPSAVAVIPPASPAEPRP